MGHKKPIKEIEVNVAYRWFLGLEMMDKVPHFSTFGKNYTTWLKDRTEPYDLGECEFHLAFVTDRYDELYRRHKEMGCVCFENPAMGIYFIEDPDGYWIEIVPARG